MTVYLLVLDGFADWEPALAVAWLNASPDCEVRVVGFDKRPVRSMGGLQVVPDVTLDAVPDDAPALILPGGDAWQSGCVDAAFHGKLRRLHESGVVLAAICGATIPLADAGLFDERRHTSNGRDYLAKKVPSYSGQPHYEADAPAVLDDGIITAGGDAPTAFAQKILEVLEAYSIDELDTWERLFARK